LKPQLRGAAAFFAGEEGKSKGKCKEGVENGKRTGSGVEMDGNWQVSGMGKEEDSITSISRLYEEYRRSIGEDRDNCS
jgi:hypothetical protein